ncbi:hypothetical protein HPB47_005133 [Ixodes persulcatus]|uniref:Uncharacterized protein n=1 Tax=Ixodes persulcatus TaxID=34615 RepID=A0AC60PF74_IXOPE|nr:hypothetical protein HPB47_005133 [Ixodes persulcatus]
MAAAMNFEDGKMQFSDRRAPREDRTEEKTAAEEHIGENGGRSNPKIRSTAKANPASSGQVAFAAAYSAWSPVSTGQVWQRRALPVPVALHPVEPQGPDLLVTFRDILDHYTGERLRYPPAHPSLDKRTSVAWCRLQTGSFPSPSLLNKWYPDKYKPNCKLCGVHANLRHIVWECSRIDRKYWGRLTTRRAGKPYSSAPTPRCRTN